MSEFRLAAAAAAGLGFLVGGLVTLGQFMPVVLDRRPSDVGGAVALVNGLRFLLLPVAVAVVGYAIGRRVDVSEEYARIALRFGLFGAVGIFAGGVTVRFAVVDDLRNLPAAALTSNLLAAVFTGVSFGITAVAAAAVAQFRND